jgi:hypothetical protein
MSRRAELRKQSDAWRTSRQSLRRRANRADGQLELF